MSVVEDSILVSASPEEAFDLSQDYDLRLKWDPFLSELRFLDAATTTAQGVKTWVRSKGGLEMTAEYVAVDRPRVVAIRMLTGQGPWFFATFGGSWRFRPVAGASTGRETTTEVSMRYTFELAPSLRLVRWAAERVVRRVFLHDVRARLAGLKRGLEEMGLRGKPPQD